MSSLNLAVSFGGSLTGNMSGNLTSNPIDCQAKIGSIQAVFAGSPVGSLSLNVSDDGVNWDPYPSSSSAVSGAGHYTWLLSAIPCAYLQVVYAFTSGSGSLTLTFSEKSE